MALYQKPPPPPAQKVRGLNQEHVNDRPIVSLPGPQQVYVIQHELGPVKIGRAKDPKHRLREIQVSSPYKLVLKKTETPHDAKEVEGFLHKRFSKYRMRGEWFDIPIDERDFEIPTHVNDLGIPDVPVEIISGRDMDTEWAESLERLTRAMRVTKYETSSIKQLRTQWREFGDYPRDQEEDESDELEEAPDLQELENDLPTGKVRCSQCGHHFDRGEMGCPTCGGGAFTDDGGR